MSEKANSQEAAASTPKAKATGITKVEAVRQAMEKLGKDASRVDIQSFVKDKFGFEMSTDHVSNCKNELQKKAKAKGKSPAKAAAPKAAAPKAAAPKAAAPKAVVAKSAPMKAAAPEAKQLAASGISLNDIQTAKDLVARVGPEQLRSLVDLLVK